MYKKILLIGTMLSCNVSAADGVFGKVIEQAPKVLAHGACFLATAYWVKSQIYDTHTDPMKSGIKTAVTLGLYLSYTPSISLLQGALWMREALESRGYQVTVPEMRAVVPALGLAAAGFYKAGLWSKIPSVKSPMAAIAKVHEKLGMSPDIPSIALLTTGSVVFSVWYYLNTKQEGQSILTGQKP